MYPDVETSYFAIESSIGFPRSVHAGVVLRNRPASDPLGATFWRAGTGASRLVDLNRRILALEFGIDPDAFRFVRQVHGDAIVKRRGDTRELTEIPNADGQWCSSKRTYLVANVADCCPVVVYAQTPRRIALLHSGWRGTSLGIVPALVEQWRDHGVEPDSLLAWIGPCADGDRYEVGPDVADRLADYPGAIVPSPHRTDRLLLDIPSVIVRQLRTAGVPDVAIARSPGGTISDRRYHSHRRDRFAAGRMLAFAALL